MLFFLFQDESKVILELGGDYELWRVELYYRWEMKLSKEMNILNLKMMQGEIEIEYK